jgi:gluconate 2-dehydrogenase alpha chain
MPKTMKPVDAVLIGVGWTGGILARELTKAGLNVVGLERGDFRNTNPDFLTPGVHDELAYAVRNKLFQNPARDALSFRNNVRETALPIRQFGSFLPGDGLGGAGVHWNGLTWRFLENEFKLRSNSIAKYGAAVLGEDCTSADWGVSYQDLEPHYDRFEYLCGISGKAGNLNGKKVAGGNVFEGPRKREYPNPPLKHSYSQELFRKGMNEIGLHPFISPSANNSQPYKNPEGVQMGACAYCGFCERFTCEMSAKGSLQTTLLPVLLKEPKFELRTNSHVLKINVDSTGKKATGVTYLDPSGQEVIQPANMVFLTAFSLNNVHLLLLSKIGKPYDPATGQGVIGKNYTYQTGTQATLFYEGKNFNQYMGAGSLSMGIDDYNGDNFDHSGLDFIGGGVISQSTGSARPIQYHPVPKGTPRWGAAWKAAAAKYYNSSMGWGAQGSVQAYRGNYLDLDPTYTNEHGQPLMRMTFDWGKHERKYSDWLIGKYEAMVKPLNPQSYILSALSEHYSIVPYQSTHNTGGAIMGTDPSKSAVNTYMQVWDCPNVFSMGASAFPQNAGYNPTGTVGALAYRTAEAVTKRYIKNPGLLT